MSLRKLRRPVSFSLASCFLPALLLKKPYSQHIKDRASVFQEIYFYSVFIYISVNNESS
jgi:hypothetical protein